MRLDRFWHSRGRFSFGSFWSFSFSHLPPYPSSISTGLSRCWKSLGPISLTYRWWRRWRSASLCSGWRAARLWAASWRRVPTHHRPLHHQTANSPSHHACDTQRLGRRQRRAGGAADEPAGRAPAPRGPWTEPSGSCDASAGGPPLTTWSSTSTDAWCQSRTDCSACRK